MQVCVLDIEGNGLGELVLDAKGRPYTEATRILCAATQVNDQEPRLW